MRFQTLILSSKEPNPLMATSGPVSLATQFGIGALMLRLKGVKGVEGKERIPDIQGVTISVFAGTIMHSLVSGMELRMFGVAVIPYLLVSLGIAAFVVKFSELAQGEDPSYMKTKGVLKNHGRATYEKNFKKGIPIDNTLPFLTDSALKEAVKTPHPQPH